VNLCFDSKTPRWIKLLLKYGKVFRQIYGVEAYLIVGKVAENKNCLFTDMPNSVSYNIT
jgi:hypothetical protein